MITTADQCGQNTACIYMYIHMWEIVFPCTCTCGNQCIDAHVGISGSMYIPVGNSVSMYMWESVYACTLVSRLSLT